MKRRGARSNHFLPGQTAALFGVGEATVSRLLRLHRETGDVEPKPKGGNNPRRVDLEWLRRHLAENPDARLVERIDAWVRVDGKSMSVTAMWLAVRACGWTHKKRQWSPANETGRTSKRSVNPSPKNQHTLNPAKLVFLDESGFRLGAPPNYGWAPVGEKSPGKATCGAWCTMTMLGAIALDGWRGFVTIDAATDGDVFLAFVEQQLTPNLRSGDLVVMDNLNAHKAPSVIAAIRAVGADVLFLPPYSPEYNPIEKAWAKLKDIL